MTSALAKLPFISQFEESPSFVEAPEMLKTQTSTDVSTEQADNDASIEAAELKTKTMTATVETSDADIDMFALPSMATQTFTKSNGETNDADDNYLF